MECTERCGRLHPHCTLTLTRDIAPDKSWHWLVTMPDGHIYDCSHGRMAFEQAITDMQSLGVVSLDAADVIWRKSHPPTDRRTPEGE